MTGPQRVYTDDERADAVAEVIAGRSILGVAEARGVPYSTLHGWVSAANEALGIDNPTAKQPYDHVALTAEASARAFRIIGRELDRYESEGRRLDPGELQRIAIVGGISTDKHLDYRDGRKGTGLNVDARTMHVSIDASQAAALIAEAQRRGLLAPPDELAAPPST